MTQRNVLFVGGPAVGKTNYLLRLWLALRDGANREIAPRGLPDDATFLNNGLLNHLAGSYAARTPVASDEKPEIPISIRGVEGVLSIPDRAGEEWTRFYEQRRWPAAALELVNAETAFLVFVRADSQVGQATDWFALQRFLGPEANFGMQQDQINAPPPAQVVLVDWIQLILALYRHRAGPKKRPRVGIVVTAWDKMDPETQAAGPIEFLRNEHKLLYDFVVNNADRADLSVFATSLYGGDLDDATFKDEFLEAGRPRDRGWVQHNLGGSTETSSDLLIPIGWALGIDNP